MTSGAADGFCEPILFSFNSLGRTSFSVSLIESAGFPFSSKRTTVFSFSLVGMEGFSFGLRFMALSSGNSLGAAMFSAGALGKDRFCLGSLVLASVVFHFPELFCKLSSSVWILRSDSLKKNRNDQDAISLFFVT